MKSGLKVDGFFENFAFFNFFYISKDKFLHKGLEPAKINTDQIWDILNDMEKFACILIYSKKNTMPPK